MKNQSNVYPKDPSCPICYPIPIGLSPERWVKIQANHDAGHPNSRDHHTSNQDTSLSKETLIEDAAKNVTDALSGDPKDFPTYRSLSSSELTVEGIMLSLRYLLEDAHVNILLEGVPVFKSMRSTLQQFEKQTIKKARWGHMSAYDDGHTQGKREGALAVLAEVREKYYKGVEVMDILDSLKEKYTKDV